MKEKVLVSACLLGKDCKYNGGNNYNQKVIDYLKNKEIIFVCPEQLGLLPTPRKCSEIKGLTSNVFIGTSKVLTEDNEDVTLNFLNGAKKALSIALNNKVSLAILKNGSPSCGVSFIYDGTFTHTKVKSKGVFAYLLNENKIKIISEDDL